VIDLVNRLNMAFDVWDLDTMLGLLTDDFTVHQGRGHWARPDGGIL
jgi:hypothetical protein